ncbi:hypothetical protein G6F56_010236 [Rhizopus delemar]|nr:hypothetical protein G6F56_010236 [Rhizopus delemar]
MYYRNANCAVVVYDVTQTSSLNKDRSWIEELQRQSDPNITIALTSNKYDLESRTVIDTKPAKKYAEENKTLFYETSAKTGHNFEQ